jgi:hypothetical protein
LSDAIKKGPHLQVLCIAKPPRTQRQICSDG